MNWAKGYTSKYVARLVDWASFNDMEEIPIISGSISRDITSNLLESASIETHQRIDEQWVRIYMIATQNGGSERIPLFTGLASTPARDIKTAGRSGWIWKSCFTDLFSHVFFPGQAAGLPLS